MGFGSKKKRHLLGCYAELVYCSGYLDASRYEDFACQVEPWEEISELSEEDYQRYLADVRIPNMIDKGLSDTYWECYWEAVSEAAHTLLREYLDRNTHSDTESGKG